MNNSQKEKKKEMDLQLFLRSISMQIVQYVVQYQIVTVLVLGLQFIDRKKWIVKKIKIEKKKKN